ncbi:MAG TPA: site-2 protease family protein [Gemmataceae bacterium]|nr:site-2 protease family protein [Gemmataceae bacterium]
MIEFRCENCRALLALDADLAGREIACPDCAASIRVPSGSTQFEDAANYRFPTAPARAENVAVVRIFGLGKWMLFDMSLPIYVDGRQVAVGSMKKGFDVTVKLDPGEHDVEIGAWKHTLDLPRIGNYEAEFAYSSMWGKYTAPKVRRCDSVELDWPPDETPIDTRLDQGEISPEDEAVLIALEELQNKKAGWGTAIVTLVISLLLFSGAAGVQDIVSSLVILIPVLLFHELGHYLTMLAFGYRNLRMFFIPFFGAAVSGQHYNVAGWKKSLVALAGPLPGIALGVVLGAIGIGANIPLAIEVALMLVILNGFNILPMLPLDGGWVVHAVLFVRHPVLDLVFRVTAGLAMIGLGIVSRAWVLGLSGAFMLISAPMAYRTARIARQLGHEGLVTRSIDGRSIPQEAALRILAELRKIMPAQTAPSIMAQHIANVFEAFNAEPPGVLASIGLLFLHGAGFVLALVMAIVLTLFQHRPLG